MEFQELSNYEQNQMDTPDLQQYLDDLVEYVRSVRNRTGRKVHIFKTMPGYGYDNGPDRQAIAYCGKGCRASDMVSASVALSYEADDRDDIFCRGCLNSLMRERF